MSSVMHAFHSNKMVGLADAPGFFVGEQNRDLLLTIHCAYDMGTVDLGDPPHMRFRRVLRHVRRFHRQVAHDPYASISILG